RAATLVHREQLAVGPDDRERTGPGVRAGEHRGRERDTVRDGTRLFGVDGDPLEVAHGRDRWQHRRIWIRFDVGEGTGLVERERTDMQAAELTEVRDTSEAPADVGSQGPHVRAAAALDQDRRSGIRTGREPSGGNSGDV